MRKIILTLLATCLPVTASYAGGMDTLFLEQVYPNGGSTLYCQEPFQLGDRILVTQIYDERRLAQHFGSEVAVFAETIRSSLIFTRTAMPFSPLPASPN